MARTALTVTATSRSGVPFGAAQQVLMDRTNGMQMANDGMTVIAVQNIHASNIYALQFNPHPSLIFDGVAPTARNYNVPANSTRFLGPFPTGKYSSLLTFDTASVGAETNIKLMAFTTGGGIYRGIPVAPATEGSRVLLPLTQTDRAGAATYGSGTGEVGWSTNGHYFPNDGQVFLHVRNPTGGSIQLNIVAQVTDDGQAISDYANAIAAGTEELVGPFPPQIYNNANGHVLLNAGVTGGFFKAFWIGMED